MNKSKVLHTIGLAVVAGLAWLAVHLKDSPYWWAPAVATLAAALAVQLPKIAPSVFGPLLILGFFALHGCWLTKPPPVTPTVPDGGFADASAGTTFVDCSDGAVHDAELKLLPDIMTDLALGSVASVVALEALLAQLTVQVGAPLALSELSCGVQWCVAEAVKHLSAAAQAGAETDPVEKAKEDAGAAWFAKHPVTFAGSP